MYTYTLHHNMYMAEHAIFFFLKPRYLNFIHFLCWVYSNTVSATFSLYVGFGDPNACMASTSPTGSPSPPQQALQISL